MDTKENLTTNDILNLLDELEKTQTNQDTLTISANSLDSICLSDYDWGSMALHPLSTDQLSSIQLSPIQPLTTAQLSTIIPSSIGVGTGINYPSNTISTGINYPSNTISSNMGWSDLGTLKNSLEVTGDANFEGEVKIKGRNLSETLDAIEQRLALLKPNKELENSWEELKELGNRYRELEAEIIAKSEMFKTLKN
jgi:hypothetical protein